MSKPLMPAKQSLKKLLGAPGSRLYHYTSRERAFEHILPTGMLRAGPFEAMNDPREAMDWSISMVRTTGFEPSAVRSARASFNAALKSRSKVACFTQDDVAGASVELGRGWAHPRMWAQYADDHRGVCLIFDRDKLVAQMSAALSVHGALYEGAVDYTNDHQVPVPGVGLPLDVDYRRIARDGLDAAVAKHLAIHHRHLFFSKLKDWADETEYRFVVFGASQDPIFTKVSPALVAVCVGWRFHRVYEPSLMALTRSLKVSALRCDWQDGYPTISNLA